MSRIQKILKIVKKEFEGYDNYRYEHTLRCALNASIVARNEGLDEEALVAALLLHDISYPTLQTQDDYENHGIFSARIAKKILVNLEFEEEIIDKICFGIAIHTNEDQNEFSGTFDSFTKSVSDCDNIDRFDYLRIIANLSQVEKEFKTYEDKIEHLTKTIARWKTYQTQTYANKTSTAMFRDKLSQSIELASKQIEQYQKSSEQALLANFT